MDGAGDGREGSETVCGRGWGRARWEARAALGKEGRGARREVHGCVDGAGGGKSEGREMGGVWVWTGLRKEEGGEREMLRGRRCASGVILRG